MNRWLACMMMGGAMLMAAGGLAGCQESKAPGAGMGDPYPAPLNDPQITVLAPELREWLGFQPAVVVNEPGEVMKVQQPVRNLSERQYLIDYRILFYDANGLQLEPTMGWTMVALGPKQTARLTANSLDDRAENYRLEVKWAR